jgi:hypothetical protein
MSATIHRVPTALDPSTRLRVGLILATIAVFGGVALLPQCLPNDWFFLDTPTMKGLFPFQWALLLPNPGSGRHLAFYQLFHGFAQFVFGPSPRSFFLLQSLFILAAVALLFWRLRRIPNAAGYIPLFLLALFPCSAADLYATAGKSETIAIVFFLLAVAIVFRPSSHGFALNALLAGTTTMLLQWTKETAPALVLFFLVFNAITFFSVSATPEKARPNWGLSIGSLLGLAAAKIITAVLTQPSIGAATYIQYTITPELLRNNLAQYWRSSPTLFLTGGIALASIGWCLRCRLPARTLAPSAACLAAALSYFCGLLLWKWPQCYYISIPEILFAFSALFALSLIPSDTGFSRATRAVLLTLFVYAGLINFGNFQYFSTAQRAVSHSYAFAAKAAAEKLTHPVHSGQPRLYLANFPPGHEAVQQTAVLLRGCFHLQTPVEGTQLATLGLRPAPINTRAVKPAFHRGDLVLVLKQRIQGLPHQPMRCISPSATPEPSETLFPESNFERVALIDSSIKLPTFALFGAITINKVDSGAAIYRYTAN